MAVSDATWLDQAGHVRLVGQLSGDFGGLPTGWTEAGNPADVDTHGGHLTADDGTNETRIEAGVVVVESDTTSEQYVVAMNQGFFSSPITAVPAFSAVGDAGGTVALDGGGLALANIGDAAIGMAGSDTLGFYGVAPVTQAAAPVTLGDVIAALQALGLVAT